MRGEPRDIMISSAQLGCRPHLVVSYFSRTLTPGFDMRSPQQASSESQKWQIGFEASCEVVSVTRSSRSALSCNRPERFSPLADRLRSKRPRPYRPRPEMADRFRGVVRWALGGEEPAERTRVREQLSDETSLRRECPQRRISRREGSQRAASVRRIGSETPFLVGHPGLEPGANGLRIRTNRHHR
jgi:hypothetical protein